MEKKKKSTEFKPYHFGVVQIKCYKFKNINLISTLLKNYQIKTYSQNWVTPFVERENSRPITS